MFKNIKQLFAYQNKDIRQRLLFTLFALAIFVIGVNVRIPGTADYKGGLGFLELVNLMSGEALRRSSIFALGISPYITASIIMQILQLDIIPYFSELRKEGPNGRQKINKYTRYLGIFIAFIQGYALSNLYAAGQGVATQMYIALILTAGTAFILWLSDQVTQKGIGNGSSLMIMAGIVITLRNVFQSTFTEVLGVNAQWSALIGILLFSLFIIIQILIIVGMIFVQEADRKIPIQYANKSTLLSGNQSYLPIKINIGGVMPVIFASTILTIPVSIVQLLNKPALQTALTPYFDYTQPFGFVLFIILMVLFSYLYAFIQIRPAEFAKNLNENGGFIPGVRPGRETEGYLKKVIVNITASGALFITIIAALPVIFSMITKLPSNITIGGTGMLIVVGVILDTYKQLEGALVSRTYKKGYTKR